jgi:hypothetical protein
MVDSSVGLVKVMRTFRRLTVFFLLVTTEGANRDYRFLKTALVLIVL